MTASTGPNRYLVGLLLLTCSTGAVDAVSYVSMDRVFTGNMTGNVIFLGFAMFGIGDVPFLNNAVAVLGFVFGVIVGARAVGKRNSRPAHPGLPRRSLFVLIGGGVVALAIATVWVMLGRLPEEVLLAETFALAAVMGAQVAAVKPIGNSDVTTVVVTNTIANLSRDSRLAGGRAQNWLPRLLAIVAMGAGAMLGAAAILLWGGSAALYVAMVVYAGGVFALWRSRRVSRSI